MKCIRYLALLCPMLLAISGCRHIEYVHHDDLENDPRRGQVVSVQTNVHLKAEDIRKAVQDTALANRVKYDVTCYKVRYKTLYGQDLIVDADALLIVPTYGPEDTPRYAAYFHGTILPFEIAGVDTSLPSDFTGYTKSKDVLYCTLPLAAAGYCVVTPDYTGFGPTAGLDTPFIYFPELVKSALDGLIACRDVLINRMHVGIDEKDIWLSGWSQGGGLSMYFHKMVQGVMGTPFRVKANSILAGVFNTEHMMKEVFDEPDKLHLAIALYTWAIYAFNQFVPDMHRPHDQIFRLDIFDQIGSILMMSNSASELFQDFFIKHITDGTDIPFTKAVKDCTTAKGWTPYADIYLHHGTDDILVPFYNMTDAAEGLKDSGMIHIYKKEGGGHDTFVPEFMAHTIDVFEQHR